MDKNIVTERDDKSENEIRARVDTKDLGVHRELTEDLAVVEQALEEYEAQGIEGATTYSEYRTKRIGSKTSMRA